MARSRCVALFAFAGTRSTELRLAQGSIVDVINKKDTGWWLGTSQGYSGVFPCTYVRELTREVLQECVSVTEIESIGATKGKRLLVVHTYDNGYLIVGTLSLSQVAVVPGTAVRILPSRAAPTSLSQSQTIPQKPRTPPPASLVAKCLTRSQPAVGSLPQAKPLPRPPSSSLAYSPGPHRHTSQLKKPLPIPCSTSVPGNLPEQKPLPRPPTSQPDSPASTGVSLDEAERAEKERLKQLKITDAAEKKERKKRKKEREKAAKAEVERKRKEAERQAEMIRMKKEHEEKVARERKQLEEEVELMDKEEVEEEAAKREAAARLAREEAAAKQAAEAEAQAEEASRIWEEEENQMKEEEEWDRAEALAAKKLRKQSKGTLSRKGRTKVTSDSDEEEELVVAETAPASFMDDLAAFA